MSADAADEPATRSAVEFVGPFESHDVVFNGRLVPHLTSSPMQGGRVLLHLDRRFVLDISLQEADYLVPFLAHCIAVGMGYSSFPDPDCEPHRAQPMPQVVGIEL
ncbi:MAG TPA: hypothetical protein VIJ31_10605 [Acidothermaceae bacterium]